MADATIAPKEVKKGQANQKQIIMVAVLGLVLVVVLAVMVLPTLTGGGDSSAPVSTDPALTEEAPSEGISLGGTVSESVTEGEESTEPAPPPARPARSPFDPPR